MVILSNCTFENRKVTTQMCFGDLDKHLQDTLRNLSIDTFGCYPDLIDLTGHYKLIRKEIGPWVYAQKLENLETGKSYWFDYNTPRPFINHLKHKDYLRITCADCCIAIYVSRHGNNKCRKHHTEWVKCCQNNGFIISEQS